MTINNLSNAQSIFYHFIIYLILLSLLTMPASNNIACLNCREKKLKCDKSQPKCNRCNLKDIPCVYLQHKKTGPKKKSQLNIQSQSTITSLRNDINHILNTNSTSSSSITTTNTTDIPPFLANLNLTMNDVDRFHNFYFNSNTRIFTYSSIRYRNTFAKDPHSILHYSYMIWTLSAFYLDEYQHLVDKLYETALLQLNTYWECIRDSFHADILTYLHALCLKSQFEFLSGREMRAALTVSSSIRLTQMFGYDQIDLSPTTLGSPAIFFRNFTLSSGLEATNNLLEDDYLDPEIPLAEERRRVLWEVYAIDKWSSLVTGLPCALSLDSLSVIFTKLPSPTTFLDNPKDSPHDNNNNNNNNNNNKEKIPNQNDSNEKKIDNNSSSSELLNNNHSGEAYFSKNDLNINNSNNETSYFLHDAMRKLDDNQVLIDMNSSSSKILLLTISENIIKWCKMFLNMVELKTLKSNSSINSIRSKVDELKKNFQSMHSNLIFFDMTTEPLMNIVVTNTTTLLYQTVLIKFSSLFDIQLKEDKSGSNINPNAIHLFNDILHEVSFKSEKLIVKFINKSNFEQHLKKAPVFIVFINSIKSLFQCIAFIKRFNFFLNFNNNEKISLLNTLSTLSNIFNSLPQKSPIVEKTKTIINNGNELLNHAPQSLSFFDSFFDSAKTY